MRAQPPTLEAIEQRALPDESRVSIRILAGAVRKHWPIALASALIVTLAVAFYTFNQTRIYEAKATVMFDPQPSRPLGDEVKMVVDLGSSSYWNNKEFYKTQFWILTSPRVTGTVVSSLGLHRDASFLEDLPAGKKVGLRQVSVEDAAIKLARAVSVEQVKDSRLAVVTIRDSDPARAQKILSLLVDTYIQQNVDDVQQVSDTTNEWLHSQLSKLRTDLETSELSLHEYKQKKNILSVSMQDQNNMLREEMTQLNGSLTTARAERESIRARRDELAGLNLDDPLGLPAVEALNTTMLQGIRQSYIAALDEMGQLVGKGENHPSVVAATARVSIAKNALVTEIKNSLAAMERDLAVADRQVNGLSKLLGAANGRALDLNLMEIEYNRMYRAKENNEKLLSLVMTRSKESDLTRAIKASGVRVMDRPALPKQAVAPNVPVNLGAGALLGLLLGVALAVGRELLDRSVKTAEGAEQELGATCLGVLPESQHALGSSPYKRRGAPGTTLPPPEPGAGDAPELVVHDFPASAVAEAARALRTNIVFMSPDRAYRSLLVTSASPAEGKTTVACSIAVAMAQAGQRVALVDCDMRRPRLHRIFGKSNALGLTSCLLDRGLLDEVPQATRVPNLWIVPTGPLPPTPAELYHSVAFGEILHQLRDRFDLVVIDSPPIGPVTDAVVLSTLVDGTVMVVRAFKTRKDDARRAVRTLGMVGVRLVGFVLNAVDMARNEYGYQYYSYYQRDEDSDDVKPSPPRPPPPPLHVN